MSMAINGKALDNLKKASKKIKHGETVPDKMNTLKYESLKVNSMGNVYVVDSRTENNCLSYKDINKLIDSRR